MGRVSMHRVVRVVVSQLNRALAAVAAHRKSESLETNRKFSEVPEALQPRSFRILAEHVFGYNRV